jgi:hypothetical protein
MQIGGLKSCWEGIWEKPCHVNRINKGIGGEVCVTGRYHAKEEVERKKKEEERKKKEEARKKQDTTPSHGGGGCPGKNLVK